MDTIVPLIQPVDPPEEDWLWMYTSAPASKAVGLPASYARENTNVIWEFEFGQHLSYEGWTKSCRPTMLDMGTWGHECRIASWTQRAYLLAFLQPFSVCTAWLQLLGLLWRVATLTSCQLRQVSWPEHEHCRQMPYRCWLYLPTRSHSISRSPVSVTRGTAAGRPPRPSAGGTGLPSERVPSLGPGCALRPRSFALRWPLATLPARLSEFRKEELGKNEFESGR